MSRITLGLSAVLVTLVAATPAAAAPVTVGLRVEGPTKTVFEGPVTTDVRPFKFTDSATTYACDGTVATGGTSPAPVPVRNGALITAAEQHGFALQGTFGTFGASFTTVGDQNVAFDATTNAFLGEFKNGQFASLGGCSDSIAQGDDVLYAYGTGSEPLLKLTAPAASPAPGATVALKVTDAAGVPVAGAAVGSATSGADGSVSVGPLTAGPASFKASKTGTIRSNRVDVCTTSGSDGACGNTTPVAVAGTTPAGPDRTAPLGRISSVREGQRFAKGRGPRRLAGIVGVDPSGIAAIRLRLTRRDGRRCTTFDGARDRFRTQQRCGATRGVWFSAGTSASWSYLLPARLGRGRYVLDIEAADAAGNRDTLLQRGRTRIVFHVS
jgi:hypothetical protein